MTWARFIAIGSALLWPSLGSPQGSSTTWTGVLTDAAGPHPVRYAVGAEPGAAPFALALRRAAGEGEAWVEAADVGFDGVTVSFRTDLGRPATCVLQAVPARGYAGVCHRATNDSVMLTMVPPVQGMLVLDHEVLLARSAALPDVAAAATVYVLGPEGYRKVIPGMGSFTCLIARPRPEDLWPICYNPPASERMVPVEAFRVRLGIGGVSEEARADSIMAGYRDGRFRAPGAGAMAYMLSSYAWTVDAETGKRTYLGAHIHVYTPGATNALVGADLERRPTVAMRVESEGRPEASLIVPVRVVEKKPLSP